MSETFENRQFFIISLVRDWFSFGGQEETTMLWKGKGENSFSPDLWSFCSFVT